MTNIEWRYVPIIPLSLNHRPSATTLRLMAFCNPNTSASYSAMLFMHSNSKQIETRCFLFYGLIKTLPTPKLSCVFDPSKYMVHNFSVHGLFDALVLLLLLFLLLMLLLVLVQCTLHVSLPSVGKGRRPNCVFSGVGAGHA